MQVRDWPQLIALLPSLKKFHVFPELEYKELEQKTYAQTLADLTKHNQSAAINQLFKSLPKALANNPEIISQYVHFLLTQQESKEAEVLLKQALRKEFDTNLIELYGLLPEKTLNWLLLNHYLKAPTLSTLVFMPRQAMRSPTFMG